MRNRSKRIGIEATRVYDADDARAFLAAGGLDYESAAKVVDSKSVSAFIRAMKP